MIVGVATLIGFGLGISWALFADYIKAMKKDLEQART